VVVHDGESRAGRTVPESRFPRNEAVGVEGLRLFFRCRRRILEIDIKGNAELKFFLECGPEEPPRRISGAPLRSRERQRCHGVSLSLETLLTIEAGKPNSYRNC